MLRLAGSLVLLATLAGSAGAETPKFEEIFERLDVAFDPPKARPGQTVALKFTPYFKEGWHTYPTVQTDPAAVSFKNRFRRPKNPDSPLSLGAVIDPPGAEKHAEPDLNIKELLQYPSGATWVVPVTVSREAKAGELDFEAAFQFSLCKGFCFPPKDLDLKAKLTVADEALGEQESKADYEQFIKDQSKGGRAIIPSNPPETPIRSNEPKPADRVPPILLDPNSDPKAVLQLGSIIDKPDAKRQPITSFLLTAAGWGFITLLTPCVFPMIPITVSFFLKQGEKSGSSPLKLAAVYTLTIIAVLGTAAMTLLSVFRDLSVNPWMNVALGLLFITFALSLFGMFEIVLPNFLVRFTSQREGSGGVGGTVFMALSFSIISFTCVAPFLGGFGGFAASGNYSRLELLAAGLTFATAFASPFFVLALFPALLKKMPKSGGWMDTVKATMGFLELAAALKFLRTAELQWTVPPTVFTYDFVLAAWVAILVVLAAYLLGAFRLPHDGPAENVGVPKMLFALMSLALAIHLTPALFGSPERTRPRGVAYAWIDAFLLPEPSSAEVVAGELSYSANLADSLKKAEREGQRVFVDFTGQTCTNCKLNERNVFPKPQVHDLLGKYQRVQLYTDTIPEHLFSGPIDIDLNKQFTRANLDFQSKHFGSEQLPLYAVIDPSGGRARVVGIYTEGKINDVEKFVKFLEDGLK